MKEGRELDALIAVKIMGFEKTYQDCGLMGTHLVERNGQTWSIPEPIPHYSTNIADSWIVVEKFDTYRIQREQDGVYEVSLTTYKLDHDGMVITAKRGYAEDTNLTETICLAALKAVGVEVDG